MFKTRVTELLGIKYPIIQGALLWLSRPQLASAVSNAGGLGIIDAVSLSGPEELRQEIRQMKELTDKPFAVNVTMMPARRPINFDAYFMTAIQEGVKIIETSGRSPEPYMPLLKEAKVKVMHKVARLRDAKTAERVGVDIVSIVGYEAGGHPGMEDVASVVRVPICVDTVKIPVIAGGGFGDGRGLAAALAFGAEGVVMGTRFLVSQECPLHPKIKELLLQTQETDTILVERSIGMASRVVKTDFSMKVLEMEQKGATLEELFPMIEGARSKRCFYSGETNDSLIMSGQVVGLMKGVLSAKEIIENTINEAKSAAQRLNGMI